ncbi:hypothetical protein DXG01_000199 [Tephrocybe rancida]|nr:hypothetical protein DXG01_000199 [Tephrocybe rancida]
MDGSKRLTLPLRSSSDSQSRKIVSVWWFRDERIVKASSIPDILRRNNVVAGTAHAILRTLPLLDALQEDSQRLTATDLFAFQGTQTKPANKATSPSVIDEWPTLPSDPLAASITAPPIGKSADSLGGSTDEVDESNVNSLLVVADNCGSLYYFLDGTFPLGTITLGSDLSVQSLFKDRTRPIFFAHPSTGEKESMSTSLRPVVIDTPLLGKRHVRDMAKLASTARELVWYCVRAVRELHTTWFGSEAFSGARNLGPNWIQALETKQKDQFGQEEPNAILDLTTLLVTGRATDSLLDFLGSGEQMSERGIQKWESTMTEALIKLRDYSEKRIAPACQRLHLVLEELQGWAQLSEYATFELSLKEINACLELITRTIVLAAWLAATARQELFRFRAFLHWLRFETSAANPASDNAPQPRHDILEVNNYFVSGLATSSIDRWFTGPTPQFSLESLGTDGGMPFLDAVQRARTVAKDSQMFLGHPTLPKKNVELLDRNMNNLVNELAARCKELFDRAAGATTRSATNRADASFAADLVSRMRLMDRLTPSSVRERTVNIEEGDLRQYLVLPLSSEQGCLLFIVRLLYKNEALESPSEVGVVLLEPFSLAGLEETSTGLDLLEVDFLDDECVVIVYRVHGDGGPANIATITYCELGYQSMQADLHVRLVAREELMLEAVEQWKQGHLSKTRLPIKRSRALKGGKTGGVSLALNGRQGRRVACVLDSKGRLESFDMEGDDDDAESN